VADRVAGNRVVIFYKSIPQYRGRFFELLRERLAADAVEFDLIYGEPSREDAAKGDSIDLDCATRLHTRSLRLGHRELLWQEGMSRVRRGDLVIVEQASKLLLNYVLFTANEAGFIRLAFWGHGRTTRVRPLTLLGERAKDFMSRRVHWWFAYNERSAGYILDLGYPNNRVTRVQNAIDTRSLSAAAAAVSKQQLSDLRTRLGLKGDNVCIFVGGMYTDKRLPFLIAACEVARQMLPDFEMIFVGGGPERAVVSAAAKRNPWMRYVGPKFVADLAPYMLIAKLALMPGLVGLGVLDSFALRVPLVTTDVSYHSPEIEYLQNGENGLILAEAADPAHYARTVVATLNNPALLEHLRQGCADSAALYTVEAMADNFVAGVKAALGTTVRRGSRRGSSHSQR
jgi:glycosyltransferase involved in cell wall biosynthesis